MATISEKRNKDGTLTGFKVLTCLGRDAFYRQKWKSATIKVDAPRIAGLTPAKMRKEVEMIAHGLETEWKREYKEAPEAARRKDKHNYTLAEFADVWLQNNKSGWKPQTTATFKGNIKNIIEFFGTKIRPGEIDRLLVDKFVSWMRTTKRYADKTTELHVCALRAMLNYAVATGVIAKNPLTDYTLKKTEIVQPTDFLTLEEAATFIDVLEQETKRTGSLFWEAFGKVALFSGLRRGEIRGLKWADVSDRLFVRRTASYGTEGYKTVLVPPKSGKARSVPIPTLLANTLDMYRTEYDSKYGVQDDYFLFCTPLDPAFPISASAPEFWMKQLKKRYPELPQRLHLHLLRHSLATLLISQGGDLTTVKEILGHSDISTTARFYVGIEDDLLTGGLNKAAEAITNLQKNLK